MTTMTEPKTAELVPFALKDSPALIERVFPAQKISFETKTEKDAGAGQTLTALGAYWKGRKPLFLVHSVILGTLLPDSGDAESDLSLFESLLSIDDEGLARRAVAAGKVKSKDIAINIRLHNPWAYFKWTFRSGADVTQDIESLEFPFDPDKKGISISWKHEIDQSSKVYLVKKYLATKSSYEEKASFCKRPEEVDQDFLLSPAIKVANEKLAHLGVSAGSLQELVFQLGILRYGRRPKVGDAFSGGGSIPFGAASLGCDVYASDLNPIACMLTWGALNLISADHKVRINIQEEQARISGLVKEEIDRLGFESNEKGDQAKTYFYCLEIECPETGWIIPLSTSWVISKQRNVIAKLRPNLGRRAFDIDVISGVSDEEVEAASYGTVQGSKIVYQVEGRHYTISMRTLRHDYKDKTGATKNKLRQWEKGDVSPQAGDILQERLYAIQWIEHSTLNDSRPNTYFSSVTEYDIKREEEVRRLVEENLTQWQGDGLVPDMPIEPGYNTTQPMRERGWTYWHHLFNPRQLLIFSVYRKWSLDSKLPASTSVAQARALEWNSRLCRWATSARHENQVNTFSDQKLNPLYNYAARSSLSLDKHTRLSFKRNFPLCGKTRVESSDASTVSEINDIWVTDPPYADAVVYHEITEFFIAWLRRNPPNPFDSWTWDSRRSLAIKGEDEGFRKSMTAAYSNMANNMPDNGTQCVMFTHQSTGVWADMVGIFWASGLQVVSAWYIATEKASEQRKGGYVQGTIILMLRKRPAGDRKGFPRRIYPSVHQEVQRQIEEMLHLNEQIEEHTGEPVFNDADLQMAGYAAALKVLTAYTEISGEDVTNFALRPRKKGETTVVDEIVQQASETANSLLVPDGLSRETWQAISGIQRFYLRMADIETTGASKLDNYQNFAKAFRVTDYTKVMASMTATKARLKQVQEFKSRELMDTTELGGTHLGHLIVALHQLLNDIEIKVVIQQLADDLPDYLEKRTVLEDMARFLAVKSPSDEVREKAEILADRIHNQQLA